MRSQARPSVTARKAAPGTASRVRPQGSAASKVAAALPRTPAAASAEVRAAGAGPVWQYLLASAVIGLAAKAMAMALPSAG